MLQGPERFVSLCPLVTDVPAPLPCPGSMEKSEPPDLGLLAQAQSAAKRCTSPAARPRPGFCFSLAFLQTNPGEISKREKTVWQGVS